MTRARAARKGNAAEGIKDFASSGREHVQSSSQTGVTSVGCATEDRGRTPWEKRARAIVDRVMKTTVDGICGPFIRTLTSLNIEQRGGSREWDSGNPGRCLTVMVSWCDCGAMSQTLR